MTFLWAMLLVAAGAQAQVRVSVTPAFGDPVRLAAVEAALRPMLEAPRVTAGATRLVLESVAWRPELEPGRRQEALRRLKAEWGDGFRVEEGAAFRAAAELPPAAPMKRLPGLDPSVLERLRNAPRAPSKAALDAFYEGSLQSGEPPAVSGAAGRTLLLPAVAGAPAVSAVLLEPPAPKAAAPEKISGWRAAKEAALGAVGIVKNVFTWKGAAVVAGSLALVTVAPIAIYGFLILGALTSGWTIGKAIVNGYQAHQAGDAEKFYGASRQLGQGLLTMGLTMLGARNPPKVFKPHFPKTKGEWQAFASAIDDEPLVIVSLFGGGKSPSLPVAPAAAHATPALPTATKSDRR